MSTYISTPPSIIRGILLDPGHSWEDHCKRRLAQQYGHARAEAIMQDRDGATNADLAAWNGLGQRRAAA